MFFSEAELSLELLGIFKIKREEVRSKTFQPRGYDSISIRIEGSACFETQEGKIEVTPSDVLYIPKNKCYSQYTDGETILVIHFINYSFNKNNVIEALRLTNRDEVIALLSEMYQTWKEQSFGYRYKCTSLFYSVMYQLNLEAQKNSSNTALDKKLQSAINYIHANYRTEDISISKLSKTCAVSQTYFRKTFKDIYKSSPLEYINNLRLEYASHLLQSKLYTISEIGEKSGFNDSKYFSRLFKKRYGISPSKCKNINPEKAWK